MKSFPSLSDALDLMVPAFTDEGDWAEVVARAGSPSPQPGPARRRRLAVAAALAVFVVALLATPAFGVQHFVLGLLGRTNVSFTHSQAAPNRVKKQFADLAIGAPGAWAPQARAAEARLAGTFVVAGHRRRLWVVPTRRGGYCYLFELGFGGCRQTAAERARARLGLTFQERIRTAPGWPIATRLGGDIDAPSAARITVRFADGTSADVPFIWVSSPIAAGFFSYDVPAAHQTRARRVRSVTLYDRAGRALGAQAFRYVPSAVRPVPTRISTPRERILHATPPVAPTAPLQQAFAAGFSVTAGHNGAVQFTQVRPNPRLRLLVGHSVGYSCFRLTREFGIFTVRGLGEGARFAPRAGFVAAGVGTPFDGCEVEGSAGHLWPDRDASHSAVEAPFTPRGRAFFADRAAARDLSLFVRTRRVQRIRHETPARAVADLRRVYGAALARSAIRIEAAGPAGLVFSESSATGKRFVVRLRNGRIVAQNVRPYALVF